MKVDREAVATLVLPQLWAMSMGPRTLSLHHTFSEIAMTQLSIVAPVINVEYAVTSIRISRY